MRRGRGLLATAVAVVVGLLSSSAALAASPQQIYNDFADNGRLDAAYAPRDLQAALQDPTVQGYGSPAVVAPMKAEIKRRLGGGAPAAQVLGKAGRGGTLPFTGLDLGLIVGGALVLLLIGGGLRKFSRART
jgi:opacity protein-like surface antigen